MKRLAIFAVLTLCGTYASHAQRLPENVTPERYDVTLTPDLANASFSGDETIFVRLQKPATSIVLNAAELQFQEVWIGTADFKQAAAVSTDDKTEMATFTVPTAVPAGAAEIHIKFTGILNDKLRGFYLSQTARRRYAVTQFEATDARRAFPCFDEPAYKAVFRIKLIVDNGDTAISNGKIISDTPGPENGKHTLQFSDSPKMSSYLVAMMVGDFACISGGADDIPIRVCAVPEKKDLLSYALVSAEKILKFYDTYYQTKYPFQKLDIIAFPDFSAGAMENTAAITYRETLLTIDDKNASVDAHRAVADVLAHEMAHMWFGDLVTMKWWNDVWLNEGFATWMAFKPIESWDPNRHAEREEIQESQGALLGDSIASVRPVRGKADTIADIQTLFDGVAYGKAASILRMVEAYVGPDTFRKGVNAYLVRHAYGNAAAEDFWDQVAATSGKPVDKIMASFTEQPGAPLLTVSSVCAGGEKTGSRWKKKRTKETTQVTISQQRYFGDAEKLAAGSPEIWQIPVDLRPAGEPNRTYVLLTQKQQTFELPGCAPWVYANAGGRGYYRTDYESGIFGKISSAFESEFGPEERIQFLGDEWAMVRVGKLSIAEYLTTIEKMKGERTRATVDAMTEHLAGIHDYIAADTDRAAFEQWIRNLLKPMANDLGPSAAPGEDTDKTALRADVFGTLAMYGRDPDSIERARAVVQQYINNPNSVDPGIAGNALFIAAMNGNEGLYDRYLAQMKSAKTPEEYYNYFNALSQFPSAELAKRTIEFALSPDVKNQDLYLATSTLRNVTTQAAAWELFKSNFKAILAKADATLGPGLASVAGAFCDGQLRDDAQDFFANQSLSGTERILQNAKDRVNACIEFRSLQQSNLSDYLNHPAANSAAPAKR
ncbi:MAG TPA: M1 family metallopeptidase [Candidatus Acidoferrum sp.]|nr:M1 family metallopeptidase [Candidatus Acidoferrum sp.]